MTTRSWRAGSPWCSSSSSAAGEASAWSGALLPSNACAGADGVLDLACEHAGREQVIDEREIERRRVRCRPKAVAVTTRRIRRQHKNRSRTAGGAASPPWV